MVDFQTPEDKKGEKLENVWLKVYYASISAGKSPRTATSMADESIKIYMEKFNNGVS